MAHVADQRHSFTPAEPFEAMTDDAFDAWMEALPPPPDLAGTDEEMLAAENQALDDYRGGRSYPHEIVSRWLMTWGKPDRKSFSAWLAEQDG